MNKKNKKLISFNINQRQALKEQRRKKKKQNGRSCTAMQSDKITIPRKFRRQKQNLNQVSPTINTNQKIELINKHISLRVCFEFIE